MSVPTGNRWSLRRRLVFATAMLTAAAMLVLTLLVQVVLSRVVSAEIDRVLVNRAEAVEATLSLDSSGELSAGGTADGALDVGVWIYADDGSLVEGPATGTSGAPDDLSTVTSRRLIQTDQSRLYATPFELGGTRVGTVVVSEPLRPYETTERYALIASIVVGVIAVMVVASIAAWIVRRSLEPVATMALRAADWSEHDLSRRFDLGPPRDELTALASVLDDLLEQVARVIMSEQRLSSELAHELRTPLTAIRGEAELAAADLATDSSARARLERIQASIDRMSDTIGALMDAARSPVPAEARVAVDVVVAEALRSVQHDERTVQLRVLEGLPHLAVPATLASRCLVPVLENAVRYAVKRVVVSAATARHSVHITVTDDGPGWGDLDPDHAFAAGARDRGSPGAGLGLPLARRLARTAGGDVRAEEVEHGARVVITLPAALPFSPGAAFE
jgi:two-component system OmpR family sensor kinase